MHAGLREVNPQKSSKQTAARDPRHQEIAGEVKAKVRAKARRNDEERGEKSGGG